MNIGSNVNLFNKDDISSINAYITTDTNKFATSSTVKTYYISCKPNTTYSISKILSKQFRVGTSNIVPAVNESVVQAWNDNNATQYTITTDSNANYLCICIHNSSTDTLTEQEVLDSVKIEKGSVATGYSKYSCGSIDYKIRNKSIFGGYSYTATSGGVTYITNPDGTVLANGTVSGTILSLSSTTAIANGYTRILKAGSYKLSGGTSKNSVQIISTIGTSIANTGTSTNIKTFTLEQDTECFIRIQGKSGETFTNYVVYPMCIKADLPETYIAYQEQKITIPLPPGVELCKIGNYQDYIYKLGTKWYKYKAIGKVVLDGSESWSKSSRTTVNRYSATSIIDTVTDISHVDIISDYFICITQNQSDNDYIGMSKLNYNGLMINFNLNDTNFDTLQKFTTWLSNNNTIVYYRLGTPVVEEITDTDTIAALNTLYNSTLYEGYTNIISSSGELDEPIKLQYNMIQESPSPNKPSEISVVGSNINIFNDVLEDGSIYTSNGQNASTTGFVRTQNKTTVNPNTNYIVSVKNVVQQITILFYNNDTYLSAKGSQDNVNMFTNTFTTPENCNKIRIRFRSTDKNNLVKIEKGFKASQYTSYGIGSIDYRICKNLLDRDNPNILNAYATSGTTIITASTTFRSLYIPCKTNKTYKVSKIAGYRFAVSYTKEIPAIGVQAYDVIQNNNYTEQVYTTGSDAKYLFVLYYGGSTNENVSEEEMLNSIIINEYEQEQLISIPLPVNTELCKVGDYKDYIYKVKETGKWYLHKETTKVVSNGTENWGTTSGSGTANYFYQRVHSVVPPSNIMICNLFKNENVYTSNTTQGIYIGANGQLRLRYGPEMTVTQLKAWLADMYAKGIPLTMYYPLATPTDTEITDVDTIAGLEKLEEITLYKDYTLIECTNNISPYTKVTYYSGDDIAFITIETDRIEGYVDGLEAIKQAIYHILMTERYAYLIYDNNYGVELEQYIGKDLDYITATIEQTLKEALTYDLRITDVKVNSIKQVEHDKVLINFTAYTIYGNLVLEVNINV